MNTGPAGLKYLETTAEPLLYPTWLLAQPQRLVVRDQCPQYHGPLTLLAGPQRVETGWLEGDAACALRDYFVARSPQTGLVWIYRERLNGQGHAGAGAGWFLHGLYA